MSAPLVVGLDLSLTNTGIANSDGTTETVTTTTRGCERLHDIRAEVLDRCGVQYRNQTRPTPALVAIEGYAMNRGNRAHQIGELGGVIRFGLWTNSVPTIVIPPAKLKKYATGAGNADKGAMLAAAIRQLDYDGHSNDEADALWLRALGLHVLGHPHVNVADYRASVADALRADPTGETAA